MCACLKEKNIKVRKHRPVIIILLTIYSMIINLNNKKNTSPLHRLLILRGWSGPWARSWAGLWAWFGAGSRALLWWLRSTISFLWGWGPGGRFGSTLFFSILDRRSWTTARLLLTGHLLWSTTRISFRLYFRTALWAGLWFPVCRTRTRARARTRFGLARSRARSAFTRAWLPFSWLGARLSSRPWAGMMASLFTSGTRPGTRSRTTPWAPAAPAARATVAARSGAAARIRPSLARFILH